MCLGELIEYNTTKKMFTSPKYKLLFDVFYKKAYAISCALGNYNVILNEKCDVCNNFAIFNWLYCGIL